MGLLSKAEFLEGARLPYEDVDFPNLGGSIRVRGLTAQERGVFDDSFEFDENDRATRESLLRSRLILVALSVVNGAGELMFGKENLSEVEKLPATVVDKLYMVARKLSSLDGEETEKNS